MDEAIQQLLDRQEIHDLLLRYARGVDRVDRALVRSCFHEDALVDFGIFAGVAKDVYAAKARGEQAADAGAWAEFTAHYLTNVLIEVDGDHARSEAYCIAMHRTSRLSQSIGFRSSDPTSEVDGEPRDVIVGARYIDHFERRGADGWKIARRTEVWDWSRVEPVGATWILSEPPFTSGKRDGTDAVFAASPAPGRSG